MDTASSETDRYQRAYWNTLVEYIPKSGWRPPRDGKLTILDLGCGDAYYAVVLRAYFEGNNLYSNDRGRKVNYIGVDISTGDIAKARGHYRSSPAYHFVLGDAREIAGMPQIAGQADLVVIRHPDLGAAWSEIFQAAQKKLRPGGLMIFSTFVMGEKDVLLEMLKDVPGLEIVVAEKNHCLRGNEPLGTPDGYIVIAKKVAR